MPIVLVGYCTVDVIQLVPLQNGRRNLLCNERREDGREHKPKSTPNIIFNPSARARIAFHGNLSQTGSHSITARCVLSTVVLMTHMFWP